MCGWSPRTPPHSYTRPSEKHDPFIYFPYRKLTPFIYCFLKIDPIYILFFKFYPFIYFLVEKDTPLIYFWCKNDTHSYTGRPEKYTHSSRTSVYTFIMEVTPPPLPREINRQNAKRNNSCILLAICTKSLFVYEDTFAIAFKLFYNILKIVRIYCRVFERA